MNINSMKLFSRKLGLLAGMALLGVSTSVLANADGCIMRVALNDNTVVKTEQKASLYTRLGGYDAIAAVVDDLVQHLAADSKLGRFWAHRGANGIEREKQLVINFIVDRAGGPLHYAGRDMAISHKGMKISDDDWKIFINHLNNTLKKFKVPNQEKTDVVNFMESLKESMVE